MKAALFPGQGSQTVGMARDLFDAHSAARERFAQASDLLGFSLSDVCFEGPDTELVRTSRAQPALFVHSLILWELWGDARPEFDFLAGHSLGEFSALAAAGVLDFESGLKLVQARANAMQHACDKLPGTMAALTFLPPENLQPLLVEGLKAGLVVPANINSESQIVVSGEIPAVERVVACAGEFGARKAIRLKVGGAFHSPLMESAREELTAALKNVELKSALCPVVMNVSALPTRDPEVIRRQLAEQMVMPVLWWQTMKFLAERRVNSATEVGSGQVLKGLAKRTLPDVELSSLTTLADLERISAGAQAAL
jgi:[acyl-carrier-protein] S-malonyltransferase